MNLEPGNKNSASSWLECAQKIVFLGDSITEQGDPKGYVAMFRQTLLINQPTQKIEVINAGISGHKSTDMHARFESDVVANSPQIVVINVGVNDVWHGFDEDSPLGNGQRGVSLSIYQAKVQEMIVMAHQNKIEVLLLSPTIISENSNDIRNISLKNYVNAMKELALKQNCPFVNLHKVFISAISKAKSENDTNDLLLTYDGVHMNDAGNRLIANQVLEAFELPNRMGLTSLDISK